MEQSLNNSPTTENHLYKADFFRRLFAQIIDAISYIIYSTIALFVLNIVFALILGRSMYELYKTNPQLASTLFILIRVIGLIIFFVVPAIFYLRYIQKTGTTLGKKMLKLKIVPVKDSLHFKQVFLRELIFKPISLLYFGLGFFWIILDKDQQAWHDKLAKTHVVCPIAQSPNRRLGYVFMFVVLTSILGVAFAYNYLLFKDGQDWNTRWLKATDYDRLLAIQDALYSIEKRNVNGTLLCNGLRGYCQGRDQDESIYYTRQAIDGTGWIKVNFKQLGYSNLVSLPLGNYKIYEYCSDGRSWEISITYEDRDYSIYLTRYDGGNNSRAFEIGSNKSLCK